MSALRVEEDGVFADGGRKASGGRTEIDDVHAPGEQRFRESFLEPCVLGERERSVSVERRRHRRRRHHTSGSCADEFIHAARDVFDVGVSVRIRGALGIDVDGRIGSIGEHENPPAAALHPDAVGQFDFLAVRLIEQLTHDLAFVLPRAADAASRQVPHGNAVHVRTERNALVGQQREDFGRRVERITSGTMNFSRTSRRRWRTSFRALSHS